MDVTARIAIESLRLGVPSRAVVTAMPPNQPMMAASFERLLQGTLSPGFFIEGEFGSGKSHQLAWMRHEAEAKGFATAYLTIGKETSLSDLSQVYRKAVADLRLPELGFAGTLRRVVDDSADTKGTKFLALYEYASLHLHPVFERSLHLFRGLRGDAETLEYIYRFWDGDSAPTPVMRRRLREIGHNSVPFTGATQARLELDRFEFLSAAVVTSGRRGLLLLFDEVELIGKFGRSSRIKAYANLQKLLELAARLDGLAVVGAITPSFRDEIFTVRGDRRMAEEAALHELKDGSAARACVAFLDDAKNRIALGRMSEEGLLSSRQLIADLYGRAYSLPPLEVSSSSINSQSLRTSIRQWVATFDLQRLYGSEGAANIQIRELSENLDEDSEVFHDPELENDLLENDL